MSVNWAPIVTKQFRTINSQVWATVDPLAANIAIGDFGTVVNGGFNRIGNSGSLATVDGPSAGGDFSFQASSVDTTQNGGDVSGTYYDPDSGTTVTAGVQWQWKFTKTESLNMVLPTTYSYVYDDVLSAVEEPTVLEQLWIQAYQAGWMNSDGTIKTGFCMVVGLLQIAAGFVTGSETDSETFTINGSVKAMDALMHGQANAAYSNDDASSGMLKFIWPQSEISASAPQNVSSMTNLRTIAVQLASFDGYMPSRGSGNIVFPYT